MSTVRHGPEPCGRIGPALERSRIVVCVGAGGVGKTTIAAAMALRAARSGRDVACLTIDPARRLADSLGVESDVPDGRLRDITGNLGGELRPGGRLRFGMLDPVATFDAFVVERASSAERARLILGNSLYRFISRSLGGMQEYMALEKLCEIAGDPSVELIVLDTPPTANALDFFTAPRRMMEALDGPLVRAMRKAYGGPGRLGFDLVGRWAGAVLGVISRLTGAELLGEMMGFVDALSDLFGSFSQRAAAVEEVLRRDDVFFCLVTTPDEATLKETAHFRQRLDGLGLGVDAVLFNRAHWPEVPPAPPEASAWIREQNVAWNEAHRREREIVDLVREAWVGLGSVCVVPRLEEGADRVRSLDVMAGYL
jgi:anion-transporting  ArsA/GET3 family ATPase